MADRHPIFIFDSREEFLPLAVESVEALDGAELIDRDGRPVGSDPPRHAARGRRPASYEPDLQGRFGDVGYAREAPGESGEVQKGRP